MLQASVWCRDQDGGCSLSDIARTQCMTNIGKVGDQKTEGGLLIGMSRVGTDATHWHELRNATHWHELRTVTELRTVATSSLA